ncbi:MAG: glycosyltransferase [Lachnospiraceae bacterium]|nr:glycosyltransferase [Lachnospiraceae bacterium]
MLSVCIITKNESANLRRCLESLKVYPFEIVVVDTGSTDDTKQMAAEYTQCIYDFAWCDDFSAAKNYAIGRASHDMVMVLDSDEYVSELDVDKLRELIAARGSRGQVGRIRRHNLLTRDGEQTVNMEWINRIFSRELFHYEGRIHEQVTAAAGGDYETYQAPVTILHSGYEGSQEDRRRKAERNIRLLLQEFEENPADTYCMYQLGKSYYMAGNYPKAVRYFELALGYDLEPKLEYVIDMVETYGYALLKCGQAETALGLSGVYDAFGGTADFKLLMGLIYMNNEMFEEAVQEFERAACCRECRTIGANSYLAWYNAGVIRECLGDVKAAADYYAKCGDYKKAKERLRQLGG